MRLSVLVDVLGPAVLDHVGGDPEVTSVTHDSRAVEPGGLFCCVPGERADGHDYTAAALAQGAVALLVDRPLHLEPVDGVQVAQVRVADVRRAMAPVAARFHGDPSRHLAVVGVTGTNGKTTVVHLLASALRAGGLPAGQIGTLTGTRTTPEAPELHARLAAMRAEGNRAVAMEVSSHALTVHRVDGTWFEVAVFTNLSRDHLDFHPSMEDYFEAKASLFTPDRCARAVVDVDDEWGRLLAERLGAAGVVPTSTCSLASVHDLEVGIDDCRFGWRGQVVDVPLGGTHNAANALLAAEAAAALGLDPAAIARGIAEAGPLTGRFERVDGGQDFDVVVDYAHTPDALEKVLESVRAAASGRVLLVFGCGGDRDRSKRPEMGRVAAEGADVVVVTSDNPRSEAPEAIIEAVIAGIPESRRALVEPDRRAAIALLLEEAAPGDVVVVAGKGHETTQEVAGVHTPFDCLLYTSDAADE